MNALVLQCGGPTAVVNVSLAAIANRWREIVPHGRLLGGRHGLRALVTGEWFALDVHDASWLRQLDATPGMALGGGRDRLDVAQQVAAIDRLRADRVDVLVLIGGNGTMAAARDLASHTGGPQVIAVPKTIDNDVPHTAVCPGYPSAARFVRDSVRDVSDDVLGMQGYEQVVLIETMGRHAGWLAAAAWLARRSPAGGPHIVLTPETPFDEDAFVTAVDEHHRSAGVCVVVAAEGVRDSAGVFLTMKALGCKAEHDPSGQVILGRTGGPLPYLAERIRDRLAFSCRQVRPDVLQRCSRAHVSRLDRELAALVGAHAVELADAGEAGVMVSLAMHGSEPRAGAVPLARVKGERRLPPGFDVESLRPLIDAP